MDINNFYVRDMENSSMGKGVDYASLYDIIKPVKRMLRRWLKLPPIF